MCCLLPEPLAYSFIYPRFILLHFLPNFSKQRLRNIWDFFSQTSPKKDWEMSGTV